MEPDQVGKLVLELSWNLTRGGRAGGLIEMAPGQEGRLRSRKLAPGPSGEQVPFDSQRNSQRKSFVCAYLFFPGKASFVEAKDALISSLTCVTWYIVP